MSDFYMAGEAELFSMHKESGAAAVALFGNQGLHNAARAFGLAHERGAQYLAQAPVMVFAAGVGLPSVWGCGLRDPARLPERVAAGAVGGEVMAGGRKLRNDPEGPLTDAGSPSCGMPGC